MCVCNVECKKRVAYDLVDVVRELRTSGDDVSGADIYRMVDEHCNGNDCTLVQQDQVEIVSYVIATVVRG